ncbi:MAG: hypothetical protein GY760_06705 [Deltaproteobacteria bacterium]|nr:hypothetical protein [Deltaproteobacteria bacterium]
MINTGIIIVFICVGLPVICGTILKLNREDSKKSRSVDQETLEELYYKVKEMKKRITNLETILYDRDRRSK